MGPACEQLPSPSSPSRISRIHAAITSRCHQLPRIDAARSSSHPQSSPSRISRSTLPSPCSPRCDLQPAFTLFPPCDTWPGRKGNRHLRPLPRDSSVRSAPATHLRRSLSIPYRDPTPITQGHHCACCYLSFPVPTPMVAHAAARRLRISCPYWNTIPITPRPGPNPTAYLAVDLGGTKQRQQRMHVVCAWWPSSRYACRGQR